MITCVPKETAPNERRVALVPELIPKLTKAGLEVVVEAGAGAAAGFADRSFREAGARIEPEVIGQADILLKVQPPALDEISRMKPGATLIGFLQPYTSAAEIRALAAGHVTTFSMELMPRITRAQAMDALSAMSTVSGYKAVLIAANHLGKFFRLLMPAAGTI
ncbi:MAG: NAD(P)(+) transhydrogenase (Re/Si-specific) subunit alpha, partial [Acidobacteria bacterium]|nr:NAD(P)(+) transhydrogenase (Re/Si-specific) subunit alpha [Acidobacteriota bacterium]